LSIALSNAILFMLLLYTLMNLHSSTSLR